MKKHSIHVEVKNGITTVYHDTGDAFFELFQLGDGESGNIDINITGITVKGHKTMPEEDFEENEAADVVCG